jgi:glutamate formiminotransferase/formiminotetrahydrofolate cyclodeaminase
MSQLIECVPNFSEGRRTEVIDAIVTAITSTSGVVLLDRESDANHNRSVITFVGDAAAVAEAAFRGTAKAAELIDLDVHRGEHPRMGATDVIPFVPIRNATPTDCVAMAQRLGERVGRELAIPVYLYEDAATREANRNLADVRRGEYEGLKVEIETSPERAPDFGPRKLGKAGAVAIGARFPLIAYNVNLGTTDVKIAKAIAKQVRFSSGGLPFVKALGFELADRQLVQVSMNLTNYTQTSIAKVFALIAEEAQQHGVPIIESEIVGLVPQQALMDTAADYLKLANFSSNQILEVKLADTLAKLPTSNPQPPITNNQLPITQFIDDLAAPTPTPGGGSASAYAGAMAAGLVMMYAGLKLSRMERDAAQGKKQADVLMVELRQAHASAQALKEKLSKAVENDARVYEVVLTAYRIPKVGAGSAPAQERANKIQRALQGAAEVPMRVAEDAAAVLRLARNVIGKGLKSAQSDAQVATLLAQAALQGAVLNVQTNLESITDEDVVRDYRVRIDALQVNE